MFLLYFVGKKIFFLFFFETGNSEKYLGAYEYHALCFSLLSLCVGDVASSERATKRADPF